MGCLLSRLLGVVVAAALVAGSGRASAACLPVAGGTSPCTSDAQCCSNYCYPLLSVCWLPPHQTPWMWKFDTSSEGSPPAPVVDSVFNPNIVGGQRSSYSYVARGGHLHAIRNINEDGGLAGTIRWTFPIAGVPSTIESFPAVVPLLTGEYLFLAYGDGYLYRINAEDGSSVSVSTRRPGICQSDTLVAGPTVQLYAYANAAFKAEMDTHPGHEGDSLVFVATRTGCGDTTSNRVIAYYASSLTVKWMFNADAAYAVDYFSGACALDYTRNQIYCGANDGGSSVQNTLYALPTIGNVAVDPVWAGNAGPIQNIPTYVQRTDRLYIGAWDGKVMSYDPDGDGQGWPGAGGMSPRWSTYISLNAYNPRSLWAESRNGLASLGYILVVDGYGRLRMLQDVGSSGRLLWGPKYPYNINSEYFTTMAVSVPEVNDPYTGYPQIVIVGTSFGTVEQLDLHTGTDMYGPRVPTQPGWKAYIHDLVVDTQLGLTEVNRAIFSVTECSAYPMVRCNGYAAMYSMPVRPLPY